MKFISSRLIGTRSIECINLVLKVIQRWQYMIELESLGHFKISSFTALKWNLSLRVQISHVSQIRCSIAHIIQIEKETQIAKIA